MKTIKISDITLRQLGAGKGVLSFKEKLEIIRSLDRLKIDCVELPPIADEKADVLLGKTASFSAATELMAEVGMTKESVELTWSSIREAKRPVLCVSLPVSPVQMEYTCHMKAPKLIELIRELTESCRFYCENVEFRAQDATRAEKDFLYDALRTAIAAGAGRVTLCDSAGTTTPDEFYTFIKDCLEAVPELNGAELYVELSDEIGMALACAAAAIDAGACGVKTAVTSCGYPTLEATVHYIESKGADKGIACRARVTELARGAKQMKLLLQAQKSERSSLGISSADEATSNICLDINDDISEVISVVRQLGYDLTEEDNARVYEAFKRVAVKKHFVGTRELEAIVASTALQVPSTYRTVSYVINSGNIITATANVTLERDGRPVSSVAIGDGPIDAAFLAIEQIIGHHYELDDFQIQTVTEGREAMGQAIVKLRSAGRLYSGSGISTDIIGASIRAYVSALNKILYEEE